MTKQPEPSGPSMPRDGYAAASTPGGSEPDQVAVPKLKTIIPKRRPSVDDEAAPEHAAKPTPADKATTSPQKSASRRPEAPPATAVNKRPAPSKKNVFAQKTVDVRSLQLALKESSSNESDQTVESFGDRIRRRLSTVSAFLVSVIAHLTLFLILALTVLAIKQPTPRLSFESSISENSIPEDPVDANTETVVIEIPEDTVSPVEMTYEETSTDDQLTMTDANDVIPNVVSNDVAPTPNQLENTTAPAATLPTGGGLEGRELSARARLAASQGGSKASEIAVERGLKWIANHQRPDGSWRFLHDAGHCNGECRNQGTQESTTAATGLALMSFLGAGYTSRVGPYQKEVQMGLDYLRRKMRVSKNGGSLIQGKSGMYSHAIATMALSEAYILTKDTDLVAAVMEARKYIESAQHSKGGWRYIPGSRGDMTVTGWQLMALKSCELAGFKTGEITWQKAEAFIDSVGSSSGRYGYQKPDENNPTTTAVGILSKMYLGASKQSVELGTHFVMDTGPSKTDIYFDYYATQILHHLRGDDWEIWNEEMRDYLVRTQDDSDTHRNGSWYFPDQHGQVGGRLYTTAMAVMTLEVYYRYLPLYDKQAIR